MDLLTIPEALRAAAGGGCRFDFHLERGMESRTADDLLARAGGHGATLLAQGVRPGGMVGVVGLNRPEWLDWAFAIWLTGGALVPLPAPVRIRDQAGYALQVRSLAEAMGCSLIVAEPHFRDALGPQGTLSWDEPPDGPYESAAPPPLDSIAVVLCTSGSTATPKGAALSHRSFALREVYRAAAGSQLDGEVMWLPLFHAGGVSTVLRGIYQGLVTHFLPTELFARDPASWLRLIAQVGGTSAAAASSAWRSAIQAAERKPEGIDLSTIQRALFSLETIDPDVLDLLATKGARFGLAPGTLGTGYGMSECLGVAATTPGEGVRIDEVDLDELVSSRRAIPSSGGPTKRVASCGTLGQGVQLRIVDPDGTELGERQVGEIVVHSGALMSGYLGQEDSGLTPEGWFATGDVGYLAEGELFITGRVKEIIISRGHKYHPEDIERAAALGLGVGTERCVAFARPDVEGEVVVLVEVVDGVEPAAQVSLVRQAVVAHVGQFAMEVRVVPFDSIPRTPTGKMRRNEAKQMLQDGAFAEVQ